MWILLFLSLLLQAAAAEEKCTDGYHYEDEASFTVCSHGKSYKQPCPKGTQNSGTHQFSKHNLFCDKIISHSSDRSTDTFDTEDIDHDTVWEKITVKKTTTEKTMPEETTPEQPKILSVKPKEPVDLNLSTEKPDPPAKPRLTLRPWIRSKFVSTTEKPTTEKPTTQKPTTEQPKISSLKPQVPVEGYLSSEEPEPPKFKRRPRMRKKLISTTEKPTTEQPKTSSLEPVAHVKQYPLVPVKQYPLLPVEEYFSSEEPDPPRKPKFKWRPRIRKKLISTTQKPTTVQPKTLSLKLLDPVSIEEPDLPPKTILKWTPRIRKKPISTTEKPTTEQPKTLVLKPLDPAKRYLSLQKPGPPRSSEESDPPPKPKLKLRPRIRKKHKPKAHPPPPPLPSFVPIGPHPTSGKYVAVPLDRSDSEEVPPTTKKPPPPKFRPNWFGLLKRDYKPKNPKTGEYKRPGGYNGFGILYLNAGSWCFGNILVISICSIVAMLQMSH